MPSHMHMRLCARGAHAHTRVLWMAMGLVAMGHSTASMGHWPPGTIARSSLLHHVPGMCGYTHARVHMRMRTCTWHIWTCEHMHIYMHTCLHAFVPSCLRACTPVCLLAFMPCCVHSSWHRWTRVRRHGKTSCARWRTISPAHSGTKDHAWTRTRAHARVHTHAHSVCTARGRARRQRRLDGRTSLSSSARTINTARSRSFIFLL